LRDSATRASRIRFPTGTAQFGRDEWQTEIKDGAPDLGKERSRKIRIGLCEVTNGMIADTATRLEKLFASYANRVEDEKAPLFGLWRACWDNNPAF
jgi:hypothetical protein